MAVPQAGLTAKASRHCGVPETASIAAAICITITTIISDIISSRAQDTAPPQLRTGFHE
jgi:hypothetical protein